MQERRRFPRKEAAHLVFYFSKEELKGGLARTLNLSKGGSLLEMADKLEPSVPLELDIAIGENIYHLKGKVVWIKKREDVYLVGVAFEDLNLPV